MTRSSNRALALGFVASLLGCSQHDEYGPPYFRGDVDVRSCSDEAVPEALVHGSPSASGGEARVVAAVCGDLEADNTLTVNAGSLAVNGRSRLASPLNVVGGSYTGFAGIQADNTHDIDGDLFTAGDWTVRSPAHVGGDAAVVGRLEATNLVTVAGTLRAAGTPPSMVNAGQMLNETPVVANPLACDTAMTVPAAIDARDDDGVVDFGDSLAAMPERANVRLGCARYRFRSLGVNQPLTLRISGTTTIIVEGDVRIAAPMRIEVDTGGMLEFLVGGALEVDNTLSISGAPTWLGVAGPVRIASPVDLSGVLYAPHSAVALDNTLAVRGALCVGRLRIAAPLDVRAQPGVDINACLTPDAAR